MKGMEIFFHMWPSINQSEAFQQSKYIIMVNVNGWRSTISSFFMPALHKHIMLLQAWRGYNGNVYFEPIKVNQANYTAPPPPESQPLANYSEPLRGILMKSKRGHSSKSLPIHNTPESQFQHDKTRSVTAAPSSRKSSGQNSTSKDTFTYKGARQMVVLDKNCVFDKQNDRLHEDVMWLVGQESTGSLRLEGSNKDKNSKRSTQAERFINRQQTRANVKPQRAPAQAIHVPSVASSLPSSQNFHPLTKPNPRDKICRGSVAHRIYAMKTKGLPFLAVTGDRYNVHGGVQHLPSSPILRTQTHYSQSSQRTVNSPDLYHTGYERLPPLEQLRASLKHMETTNQGAALQHVIPPLERIKFEDPSMLKNKPLVKYSAEVKRSARHATRQMRMNQKQHQQQKVLWFIKWHKAFAFYQARESQFQGFCNIVTFVRTIHHMHR